MLSGPQQKFCEGIVNGLNHTSAYQAAYPNATYNSARARGGILFAKSAIQAEIARIRAKAELLSGGAVLTLVEKRKFVARLLRSNLSTFDAEVDGDLLQEVSDTEFGKKIKLCGKMEAIKLDNDLAGEGSEAKGNAGFAGLLTKLRK